MMNATGLVNNGAAVIAVGGSNVYWNEFVTSGMMANATIQECATTGCRDSPTALSPGFGAAMVADGQNVYWTTGYNATVMECPIGGCGKASVQLWSGEANQITAGIAVDETDVYWLTYLGDLFKCFQDRLQRSADDSGVGPHRRCGARRGRQQCLLGDGSARSGSARRDVLEERRAENGCAYSSIAVTARTATAASEGHAPEAPVIQQSPRWVGEVGRAPRATLRPW